MNKTFTLLTRIKRLSSPRTDTKLPRFINISSSVKYYSQLNICNLSSCSGACIALDQTRYQQHTKVLFSSENTRNIAFSRSHMENYTQDSAEAMKDQLREGCGKEACDYDQSRKLVTDHILPHILNLYASRATPQDFEIYTPHATFEDPLMRAQGVKQIKSAFYSIPKVFSESRIVDYTIKEAMLSPGKMEILIDNKQYYKFLGKEINMISLIRLYTEDGKVVRHEDWWDKKPLSNRETVKTPLLGRISEATRRASMLATHALMRFGKDPTA